MGIIYEIEMDIHVPWERSSVESKAAIIDSKPCVSDCVEERELVPADGHYTNLKRPTVPATCVPSLRTGRLDRYSCVANTIPEGSSYSNSIRPFVRTESFEFSHV